jgi:phage/plasmid-like protein (TIGR03299 family)
MNNTTTTATATETTVNEKVFELLQSTGTNWTVSKEPLITTGGIETESFGLIRSDNSKWLGTVGKQYVAFQNFELAETLVKASEDVGILMQKGGTFGGGKKVYYQAELPQQVIGASSVKRYITGTNSHDGTQSIGFGSSNTNIVCQNTYHMAYKEINRFRHTTTASDRITAAIGDLRMAIGLDEKLMENFKRMADTPISQGIFGNLMKRVFDVDLDIKESELKTQKKNKLISLNEAIEQDVAIHGGNLWALFNGITRYTNHYVKHKTEEDKTSYLMNGAGYETNLATFEEIMAWIDEHSAKVFAVSNN